MSNSLKYNAYHVLGLDTSASSKQILQRSNEIAQRIRIDDVPTYDLDIHAFGAFRTESTVKESVRRLQSPKLRVQEYFFWFHRRDAVDDLALTCFAKPNYFEAAQIWEKAATARDDVSLERARHAALARTLALLAPNGREQLDASLQAWKVVLQTEDLWSAFARSYKFDGAYAASDDVLLDFRKSAVGYVSDIYAELQDVRKANDYVYRFQKAFAEKGVRVEREILDPAVQAIQNSVGKLDAIDVREGARFDAGKSEQIKLAISATQAELNKLVDAGLFDDGEIKALRDVVANAIRRIVLDLHNHHDEVTVAFKLLEIAARIAGTESLRSMLTAEMAQIQKIQRESTLVLDIPGTFGGGKVVFSNNHLTHNNRKIFYKDVESTAYHAINRSVNLIPISQSYSYMVATHNDTVSISFGTTLYIDNAKKKDAWARLVGLSGHLIEPQIIEKLVRRIFQDGGTVHIGSVEFDRDGYSRGKLFGGRDTVLWRETVYIPSFSAGNVALWKAKAGKATMFTSIPMSTPNAVVLPEFVKSCVGVVQSHAKR